MFSSLIALTTHEARSSREHWRDVSQTQTNCSVVLFSPRAPFSNQKVSSTGEENDEQFVMLANMTPVIKMVRETHASDLASCVVSAIKTHSAEHHRGGVTKHEYT